MSDLGKHNQKMKSHLGGKKVRSLSEIRDSEPPTFSPISIMDNPSCWSCCTFLIHNLYSFSWGDCNNALVLFLTTCLLGVLMTGYSLFLDREVTWLKSVQYGINRFTP